MKRTLKSVLAALLSVLVVMTLLPVSVFAEEPVNSVSYLDENGDSQTCTTYTAVTGSDTSWGTNGATTWYVVSGTVEITGTVTVTGDVHLILKDGCDLKVNQGILLDGENSSLTIYAQSTGNDAGKLTASGKDYAAGIGSGDGGNCGNITINGGNITAIGGYAGAGIGSGECGKCGDITINGGSITANGGMSGAGIGSGRSDSNCGDITINGGSIKANGGQYAAGIGSGDGSYFDNIIISGGSIEATGGENGAGIGSGNQGICGNIIIAQGVDTRNVQGGIGRVDLGVCGAIFIDGKLTETSALSRDLTIPAGMTLTIGSGMTLTIPAGMTLTIASGATLTNRGTIENNGTIIADCNAVPEGITNTGSGTVQKTIHSYNSDGFCTNGDGYQPATLVDGYYEISNAGQLYWFAEQVNSGHTDYNGKLMNDITVNTGVLQKVESANTSGLKKWTPIVTNDSCAYQGTFDGNGKTISGLYSSGFDRMGLFGVLGSGTIKNVTVADSCFSSTESNVRVGGICGYSIDGSINGCTNSGSVTATESNYAYAGGICGDNTGSINGCTNSGSVTAMESNYAHAGGICGRNDGSITNCINSGSVTATESNYAYAGGICAVSFNAVQNCTNSGSVKATVTGINGFAEAGGICGMNGGDISSIGNCINRGSVTATSTYYMAYAGGICGENINVIQNCYSIGAVSGTAANDQLLYIGGICGYNWSTVPTRISSCYYLADTASAAVGQISDGTMTNVESKDEAAFQSGEVTWLLNGSSSENLVFYQTIGPDAYPTLDSTKGTVYSYKNCVDTQFYTNDADMSGKKLGHVLGEWSYYDDSQHQRTCTVAGCNYVEKADHEESTAATCTEKAYCNICQESYGNVDASNHPAASVVWQKTADQHWKHCNACDTDVTAQTDHSFGAWQSISNTQHERTCADCGYVDTKDHDYVYTSTGDAQHKITCTDCNFVDYAAHQMTQWSGDENACTRHCEYCTFSETCNHNFSAWQSINDTQHQRTCADCGYVDTKDHNFDGSAWVNDPVTGQHYRECADCDARDYADHTCDHYVYVDGAGHQAYCAVCNAQYGAAQAHSTEVRYDDTTHWDYCTVCKQEVAGSRVGHSYVYTSLDKDQHTITCADCDYVKVTSHNFGGDNVCDDCGYKFSSYVVINPPVAPTDPEKPEVEPEVVVHFATATGVFDDVTYYGRKARVGDVVTLKVSNTEEGDRLGLDYHNIRVEYEVEGCTMIRDNIDYHGDPVYKDGIAAEFKLAKGLNKVTATVYYNDKPAGTFDLFYCYIN